MALTLNQICGFETGGLEEATAGTVGPPTIESTLVNPGGSERSLKMDGSKEFIFKLFDGVANAGNGHIFGFALRFAVGVAPSDRVLLFRPDEGSEATGILKFSLDPDLDFNIHDDIGLPIATFNDLFTVDTWHYIEFYFEHSNSASWELFLDGTPVGSGSGADFSSNGTLSRASFLSGLSVGLLPGPVYYDDFYWLSGATSSADRLGTGFHVRGFQSGLASTTSDTGNNPTGNWSNTGKRVASDSDICTMDGAGAVIFNDANSGGAGPGPSSATGSLPASDSEIVGAKFWHRLRRTNGQSRSHGRYYGNSGDGVGSLDTAPNSTITVDFQNYFAVTADPAKVPLTTEDFYMGFGKTAGGGQDTECAEMMAMLAWASEPSQPSISALSDNEMAPQQGFHGPYET